MRTLYKLGRIALWFASIFFAFLIIVFIWLWSASPGKTKPITDSNGAVVEGSIAEIRYEKIGGINQFLILRGKSTANPVLLMLHGGPGSPQAHMNLKYNNELEQHFIVVNWDQRGAGASYSKHISDTSMTIDQFIEDTHEVTAYLKQCFGKEKIFILGHSWGSYLGMRVIHKYPNDYYAYVGIGQVSDQRKSEDLSYDFVYNRAKELNNTKALTQLEEIGAPVNGVYDNPAKAMMVQRNWVTEFGGAAYGKNNKDLWDFFIKPLIKFPEYKIKDKLNYFRGVMYTQELLWNQLFDQQLVDVVNEVEIPIYILQGTHDYQTVYTEAKQYIDAFQAPSKKFISFENSAHMLPYNLEINKFHKIMIEQVLTENK